jgi:hypothetical protein
MKYTLIAPLLAACATAGAQNIISLNAGDAGNAMAGESVTVSVGLAVEPNSRAWCGITLSFGNGKTVDRRVEDVSQPIAFPHVYDTPGTYQLRVEGKGLTRGLNSASACGGVKTATLRVGDPEQVRRAAAAADEARRAAEAAEARQRELDAKERELRVKEAELKQRELRDREAALAAREAEMRRKEAAATETKPVAAKPTATAAKPAPAAAKKDSTLDVFK